MSWQGILKIALDIDIYNECCEEARKKLREIKPKYDENGNLIQIDGEMLANANEENDCLDFRRTLEFTFGMLENPKDYSRDKHGIIAGWDACLEEKGQPSMKWHFDNEPKGDLQQMYDELKDEVGNRPAWHQLYD